MEISRGTACDAQGIYEIEQETFTLPWSLEAITNEFTNPVATYYVAKEDDKVIGYIGVWYVMDEGQITNVAVHKDYRRRGVAKALIERLILDATEGHRAVLLLEVRASNVAAQSLYELYGFNGMGTRKNYYVQPKEDAIIMALELNLV